SRRLDVGRAVRPLLFRREAAVTRTLALTALSLAVVAPVRLGAQDTSAVDRGVRIGILYRPGVRPGIVVLTGRAPALDSVRAIMARDIDYSDRFELITLPGSDSIRLAAPPPPPVPGARPPAGPAARHSSGGAAAGRGPHHPPFHDAR